MLSRVAGVVSRTAGMKQCCAAASWRPAEFKAGFQQASSLALAIRILLFLSVITYSTDSRRHREGGWWGRGQTKLLGNTLAMAPQDLNPTQPPTLLQPWASHWSFLLPPCTSVFSLPLLHSVSGLQSLKMKESLDICAASSTKRSPPQLGPPDDAVLINNVKQVLP